MNKSLYAVIEESIELNQSNMQTALPARVISFNGHTVTCEIMLKTILADGQEIEFPPLVDVIVQFPRAGGFCFTVPINVGDEGLVIFASRCIDGWYESGKKSKPLDNRMHDLSDGIFIPGINSQPNRIPNFYHDGVSMQTDDGSTFIRLAKNKIFIQGDIEHTGNYQQVGNLSIVGSYNQMGQWTQQGGEAKAMGTLSAEKIIGGGVDLETHRHVETGTITEKPQK